MTRLGQLFLQGGQWQGRQVVPAAWVREATSVRPGAAVPYYGYLWWMTAVDGTPSHFAWGPGGQLIQVVPDRHLVMVVSSYVDLRTREAAIGQEDLQRLANAVVHTAKP